MYFKGKTFDEECAEETELRWNMKKILYKLSMRIASIKEEEIQKPTGTFTAGN